MKVAESADTIRTALLSYAEVDVLYVELSHQAGAVGYFAGKLAAKEINITSGYATTVKGSKKASAVFAVSDLTRRLGFDRHLQKRSQTVCLALSGEKTT